MHRLIPDFIQQKYIAGEASGSFYAAALFVDISGFSTIADALMGQGRHGAEVLANIIGEVFDPLMQSVFAQRGFVTKLAGDAFTAVFPVESELPDAYARALAAAWQMKRRMGADTQHRTPYGTFPMTAKVGLAAGEVAWGIVSSTDKRRAAYYFQGLAIDGCARAQKLAQAGDVIADATIFEVLESMVSGEPIADHFRITAIQSAPPAPQPINLRPIEPDIMGRFFPPEATRPGLSGELRQVVSMFVSLPTVRTVDQLESFMQIVFGVQDQYGGLLNGLDFGDKGASLLLFWGAPVAHENDVTRALNFILDLQSQTVIPVNAGITYRVAHGGYSGGTLAGEYTCHGRGVNLAARFMQASPRGEIWVDENVAERAERYFEFEFEGEMAFKGFAKKQKVFALLERREEIERLFEGEMVGRRAERERLVDFVQPVWQGRYAGVLVIWGDPGIGKSRLIYDFLQYLASSMDQEYSFFLCQTDEILRDSLSPFRYWLHSYFRQSEQQSDARNKRSFNRELDELIAATPDESLKAELDRTRSFLGALVNLEWPDSLYEQLDAQHRYDNSFTGLLTLLKAESLRRPVILLLEDAHWLDVDSRAFLHQLTRGLKQEQSYPIAVLATARPEADRPILGDDITYQKIDLGQMSLDDLATLASNQLGSRVGPRLLSQLDERAEGNPFFAEQILRYLQEEELVELVEGEWELMPKQELALPADVHTVLVARLDRLTHEVKDVVQTAAVLGREFEVRLLARMLRDDPMVEEKVVQAEHLSIWTALNELRYLFKHTLLRDAAYRMQVRSRRQSLHQLAAEAMEELYEGNLSPHYSELAYHTEEARLIDKARHYLELAGEASRKAYHNSLAVDYYGRALNLTPDEDSDSRYRLLKARERLYDVLGARDEQRQDQKVMAELAEQLKDVRKQVEVLTLRAWFFYYTADYPQALEAAQLATTLAEAAEEHELVGKAQNARSWTLLQLGKYEDATQYAEKALTTALQSGDIQDHASAVNILAMINLAAGDYFQARRYQEEFLLISRKMEDRDYENNALNNLGVATMPLGDYDTARDYFEQALALSREMGDPVSIGTAYVNLSWVAASQGQWKSAIEYGEAGLTIKQEIRQIEAVAEALTWLGHAWLGLDQPDKALAAYEKSLKVRRELDQEHLAMGALAGMARAALAQNDLDLAGRCVAEIVTYLDGGGSVDGTWEPLRIYLTCYQVLQAMQDPRAGEILETAHQRLEKRASKIPDIEARRLFLENVPWNREIIAAHRAATSPG